MTRPAYRPRPSASTALVVLGLYASQCAPARGARAPTGSPTPTTPAPEAPSAEAPAPRVAAPAPLAERVATPSAPPEPEPQPDAPPLFAQSLPRGVRAARFEDSTVQWPSPSELEENCPNRPDGIIEWYRFGDPQLQVQVFAERTPASAPRDARAWALSLASRERPAIDLTPSLLADIHFRASTAPDGTFRAGLRQYQARWTLDPCNDDLLDVVAAYVQRGPFTYRVYLLMPAGWAWWDESRWPEGPIPPRVRARGRAAYQRWIAPLDR